AGAGECPAGDARLVQLVDPAALVDDQVAVSARACVVAGAFDLAAVGQRHGRQIAVGLVVAVLRVHAAGDARSRAVDLEREVDACRCRGARRATGRDTPSGMTQAPEYRKLPKVDQLLDDPACRSWIAAHGREPVVDAVRDALSSARATIARGEPCPPSDAILASVEQRLAD